MKQKTQERLLQGSLMSYNRPVGPVQVLIKIYQGSEGNLFGDNCGLR